MKSLNSFFNYLSDIKNISVSSLIKESFEYCFGYFLKNKNIDFTDENIFSKDLFIETISLGKNKFNKDIDKKYLKICNEFAKQFIEYMNAEINIDIISEAKSTHDITQKSTNDVGGKTNCLYLNDAFSAMDISRKCFNHIMDNVMLKANEISLSIGLENKKQASKVENVGISIFDLIRSVYITNSNIGDDGKFEYHSMPNYFFDGASMHLMSNNGYYENDVFSTYNCFEPKYFKTSISTTLLSNVFNDAYTNHKSSSFKNICLIPDSIDEFNTSFRKAIMSHNRDLFLVPQSIAFAIHIMNTYPSITDSYAIVDLDSEEPTFFEFKIEKDCVIRRGRKKIDVSVTTYSKLVKFYLSEYGKKYEIHFDDNDISKIISLRLLDKIINDNQLTFSFVCSDKNIISLEYDEGIYRLIEEKISNTEKNFQIKYKDLNNSIFFISSLKNDAFTFGINDIGDALSYILKRYREKLPIWKEEMPTIEVEVISKDKREFVQLVKPGVTQDIIIGYDEDIIYDVPGIFYLRAFDDMNQVATHTDIPMRRNVIGALNTNKKAVFNYSRPLNYDTEIRLYVKYNYNNENVFNLIGKTASGSIFESSWEDQGRIQLVSKVYAEVQKPTKDEIQRAEEAFDDVINALVDVVRNLNSGNNYLFERKLETISRWNRKAHYHSTKAFRYSSLEKNNDLKEHLFDDEVNIGGSTCSSRISFLLFSAYMITNNAKNETLKKISNELFEYIGKFSCIPIYGKSDKYKEIQQYYCWYLEKLSKVTDLRKGLGTMFMLSKELNNLDEDFFNIFNLIKNMVPEKYSDKLFESFTRNIAAYAWDSKTWLPTLYKQFIDTNLFSKCYHYIHHSLGYFNCDEICKHEMKSSDRGIPSLSKVRDQLECALAFINIRDEENLFFNPNEADTEELKIKLSKLSDDILKCFKNYATPNRPPERIFKSRLSIVMKNKEKTVETIYILNKALDGREVINLKYEDK